MSSHESNSSIIRQYHEDMEAYGDENESIKQHFKSLKPSIQKLNERHREVTDVKDTLTEELSRLKRVNEFIRDVNILNDNFDTQCRRLNKNDDSINRLFNDIKEYNNQKNKADSDHLELENSKIIYAKSKLNDLLKTINQKKIDIERISELSLYLEQIELFIKKYLTESDPNLDEINVEGLKLTIPQWIMSRITITPHDNLNTFMKSITPIIKSIAFKDISLEGESDDAMVYGRRLVFKAINMSNVSDYNEILRKLEEYELIVNQTITQEISSSEIESISESVNKYINDDIESQYKIVEPLSKPLETELQQAVDTWSLLKQINVKIENHAEERIKQSKVLISDAFKFITDANKDILTQLEEYKELKNTSDKESLSDSIKTKFLLSEGKLRTITRNLQIIKDKNEKFKIDDDGDGPDISNINPTDIEKSISLLKGQFEVITKARDEGAAVAAAVAAPAAVAVAAPAAVDEGDVDDEEDVDNGNTEEAAYATDDDEEEEEEGADQESVTLNKIKSPDMIQSTLLGYTPRDSREQDEVSEDLIFIDISDDDPLINRQKSGVVLLGGGLTNSNVHHNPDEMYQTGGNKITKYYKLSLKKAITTLDTVKIFTSLSPLSTINIKKENYDINRIEIQSTEFEKIKYVPFIQFGENIASTRYKMAMYSARNNSIMKKILSFIDTSRDSSRDKGSQYYYGKLLEILSVNSDNSTQFLTTIKTDLPLSDSNIGSLKEVDALRLQLGWKKIGNKPLKNDLFKVLLKRINPGIFSLSRQNPPRDRYVYMLNMIIVFAINTYLLITSPTSKNDEFKDITYRIIKSIYQVFTEPLKNSDANGAIYFNMFCKSTITTPARGIKYPTITYQELVLNEIKSNKHLQNFIPVSVLLLNGEILPAIKDTRRIKHKKPPAPAPSPNTDYPSRPRKIATYVSDDDEDEDTPAEATAAAGAAGDNSERLSQWAVIGGPSLRPQQPKSRKMHLLGPEVRESTGLKPNIDPKGMFPQIKRIGGSHTRKNPRMKSGIKNTRRRFTKEKLRKTIKRNHNHNITSSNKTEIKKARPASAPASVGSKASNDNTLQ